MASKHSLSPIKLREAFSGVVFSLWSNRRLVSQLVRRDFESRFKGSALGMLWVVLNPLMLLLVYTFVFSQVFKARWSVELDSPVSFALILFAGLIAFNVFAENLNAAPRLMLNHVSYIKKVVFPLEILPWVSLLSSLITALISSFLLFLFYTFLLGIPSLTVLYVPLIAVPLCLTTLGVVWFVASLGVFLRDLQHAVGICVTVLLFLSPIFYPLSAVPDFMRKIVMLNPLTAVVEMLRGAIFFNAAPSLAMLGWAFLLSWCVAAGGFWWFMRIKKGFADVV